MLLIYVCLSSLNYSIPPLIFLFVYFYVIDIASLLRFSDDTDLIVWYFLFVFVFVLFYLFIFRYCLYIPSNMFLLKLKDNWLIIWLSNILALGVPDEGYSRNASCALNLISTVLLRQLSVFLLRTYIGIPGLRPLLFLSNQLNKMTIAIYNYKRLDS